MYLCVCVCVCECVSVRVFKYKTCPLSTTLTASGFPLGTTEEDVNRLFCMQPGYIAVSFVSKPGKLPCAWIQFQDVQCAAAAKMVVDGTPMYGKPIRVGYARSEMKRYTNAHIHTHTRTHKHTRTHALTHTHTPVGWLPRE